MRQILSFGLIFLFFYNCIENYAVKQYMIINGRSVELAEGYTLGPATQDRDPVKSEGEHGVFDPSMTDGLDSVWFLNEKRGVVVKHFQDQVRVDLREYYITQDNKIAPSRTGIMLHVDQWRKLYSFMDEIDEFVDRMAEKYEEMRGFDPAN